jgi:NAD(P)-dependent dehydrogenase (short-subunit alcohol dehydrogenase family)
MTKPLVILVTGATAGIGRATALHLHSRGHRVIGTGRNAKALAELKEVGITALSLDVTSQASIDLARADVDRVTESYGLDVLVNNAGYGLFGPLEVLEDADVRAQFDTNVFGLLAVTRAFLPAMRERRSGRIVNVSSVGGRMVFPLGGAYHATKFAVEAMSTALRLELKPFGVTVSVVEPGYIKTDFTATTLSHADKYAKDADSPYAHMLNNLSGMVGSLERFAVGPGSVARVIEAASVSRFPRARYIAPFYNAMGPIMLALTPTFVSDWFFRRAAGLLPPPALPAKASSSERRAKSQDSATMSAPLS